MKKRTLLILTAVFSIILLVYACRRDLDNIIKDQEVPAVALETAKVWYMQQTGSYKGNGADRLKPLWRDAWNIRTAGGNSLLVVPTPEHYVQNRELKIRRVVLFTISNGQVKNGSIIEFIGNNYDVTGHLNELVLNHQKSKINGFSGSIIQYDVNYKPVKSDVYENGEITGKKTKIKSLPHGYQKSADVKRSIATEEVTCDPVIPVMIGWPDPLPGGEGCTVYYLEEKTVDDNGCYIWVCFRFQSVSCSGGSGSAGGSGSGSGSGSAGGDGNPPYGGGGGGNYLLIKRDSSVTNNAKISCILNNLEGKNTSGQDISQTKFDDLLTTFREGSTWNLTYKLDEVYNSANQAVNAQTKYVGENNFEIHYNIGYTDMNASVIGKTFIHEAFHAYLSQKAIETWGSGNPQQWKTETEDMDLNELLHYIEVTKNYSLEGIEHDFMAKNLDRMIPVLKEFIDPYQSLNLPDDAYKGLMLQGLEGSKYYEDNIATSTETKVYDGQNYSLKDYYNFIVNQKIIAVILVECM